MKKLISLFLFSFCLLAFSDAIASAAVLERDQYDVVQLFPQTLGSLKETKKPGLWLSCCRDDAARMDMATLSDLIQKRRNLSVVDFQNFPIDGKQAYQFLNSLDKSRIDSVKFPPIFIYFSKEQQHDSFNDTVLSSYRERNLYVVFGK